MLVCKSDYKQVEKLLGGLNVHNYPISLIECCTDDLWLRDTGPTYVRSSDGKRQAINFNFNGWGKEQE